MQTKKLQELKYKKVVYLHGLKMILKFKLNIPTFVNLVLFINKVEGSI